MYGCYIVNSDSLLCLLFYADGDESFCVENQSKLFAECYYRSYKIIIPCHCFFEILDKIRLGRLHGKQAALTSHKAVVLLEKLLSEYECQLESFDSKCLEFIFNEHCVSDTKLSMHLVEKLLNYYKADMC